MKIVKKIEEVRDVISMAKNEKKRIGFIPTMGYLHRGHLSLVEISKKNSDFQVMSIFVNKIQFNDSSDFDDYPKDLQKDFQLAEEAGVDLIFVPDDKEIFRDHLTYVEVEGLTNNLCGGTRQGHFRGVFTIVTKLFNIISPDVAVFGQKDVQQAISIEKMVFDLNSNVRIIVAPIIREKDGLAMSSRNKHLNKEERKNALSIFKTLKRAEDLIKSGMLSSKDIIVQMKYIIEKVKPQGIDYISVVDYKTLQSVEKISDKSVIAIAVFFGTTRLIDNMIVEIVEEGYRCFY